MTLRRGSLYAGVFLLAAGAVTLLDVAGVIDPAAVADALGVLLPLAVIAIGVGLVLRRSPAALPAGIVAAAMPGLVLGSVVVAGPDLPVTCADATGPARAAQAPAREGSFGQAAVVDLTLNCGSLTVTTAPGNAWRLDAREGGNPRTDVRADASRLVAASDRHAGGWRVGAGRVDWDVVIPTGAAVDLRAEVNAGRGSLALGQARLGRLDVDANAAGLDVDLTGATLERLVLAVNAGKANVTLPAAASFGGEIHANAGSLAVCVPDGLGLRLRSTTTLGSTTANGLVRRGDTWVTPSYDTAPYKADLAVEANVGSVTINPEGGCK